MDACVEKGRVEGGDAHGSLSAVPGLQSVGFEVDVSMAPPRGMTVAAAAHAAAESLWEMGEEYAPSPIHSDPFASGHYRV